MSKKFLDWQYLIQDSEYVFGRILEYTETKVCAKFLQNTENNALQQKIIDAMNADGLVCIKFFNEEEATSFVKALNSISFDKAVVVRPDEKLFADDDDDVDFDDEDFDDEDFDF